MITSILYKATRDEVQFIFIDPKRIELGVYADIPHLKTEVVVEPKKAANALRWAVAEMERRYRLLAEVHVRSIAYYNRAIRDPEVQQRLALRDEDGDGDVAPGGPQAAAVLRDRDRRAGRPDDGGLERGRDLDRPPGADGARGGHPSHRGDPAAVGGRPHRHHQGELPLPHLLRHREPSRLAHHPRPGRLREAARQGRHAVHAARARRGCMRLHGAYISEQETAGLVRWLKKQGKPQLDPDGAARPRPRSAAAAAATTAPTSCSTKRRAWW